MERWQADADLAGVRDKEALAKLPAEGQEAYRQPRHGGFHQPEEDVCQKNWQSAARLGHEIRMEG
jgi:hypothetical protein